MNPFAATPEQMNELFEDPALTVACVLLIVVSVGWVVITRLIVKKFMKAARRGQRNALTQAVQSPRDIWSYPP